MNRDSSVPVNLKVGLGLNLVPETAVGYFIYAVNIVSGSLILPEFGGQSY